MTTNSDHLFIRISFLFYRYKIRLGIMFDFLEKLSDFTIIQ